MKPHVDSSCTPTGAPSRLLYSSFDNLVRALLIVEVAATNRNPRPSSPAQAITNARRYKCATDTTNRQVLIVFEKVGRGSGRCRRPCQDRGGAGHAGRCPVFGDGCESTGGVLAEITGRAPEPGRCGARLRRAEEGGGAVFLDQHSVYR
eukprot:scaffold20728_cov132-Isochrysis_galbana.AAC.10